ncbi:MAG: PadR family transcriptional regulator [Acidimicrobiales bacterium]
MADAVSPVLAPILPQPLVLDNYRGVRAADRGAMTIMNETNLAARLEDQLASRRGIIRACLLLLLEEAPGHGYDLLTRLEPMGFDRSNPGRIYRALRWLETAGFVEPNWETTGVGPARRVFDVTPAGRHALELTGPRLRKEAKSLDDGMGRYVLGRLKTLSKLTQAFDVRVEVTLTVQASDESAARRKVERAFSRARTVDSEVRATGQVQILEAAHESTEA